MDPLNDSSDSSSQLIIARHSSSQLFPVLHCSPVRCTMQVLYCAWQPSQSSCKVPHNVYVVNVNCTGKKVHLVVIRHHFLLSPPPFPPLPSSLSSSSLLPPLLSPSPPLLSSVLSSAPALHTLTADSFILNSIRVGVKHDQIESDGKSKSGSDISCRYRTCTATLP